MAAQTGLALENAHLSESIRKEVAQRERLDRELEIARDVQQRLFPQKLAASQRAGFCRLLPAGARRWRRLLRFHSPGHRSRWVLRWVMFPVKGLRQR